MSLRFQIRDCSTRNIVDRDLTFEQALIWLDNSVAMRYAMEPMKEDQNVDRSSDL